MTAQIDKMIVEENFECDATLAKMAETRLGLSGGSLEFYSIVDPRDLARMAYYSSLGYVVDTDKKLIRCEKVAYNDPSFHWAVYKTPDSKEIVYNPLDEKDAWGTVCVQDTYIKAILDPKFPFEDYLNALREPLFPRLSKILGRHIPAITMDERIQIHLPIPGGQSVDVVLTAEQLRQLNLLPSKEPLAREEIDFDR